jgi:hypothetical protein
VWGDYVRHGPLILAPNQVCGGACAAGEHGAALLAELGFPTAEAAALLAAGG